MHIVPTLNKGGQEKQLYELVKRLDKDRYEITVICLSNDCFWTKYISEYAKCIEIERKRGMEFNRLIKLIKLTNKIEPDIIQCWGYSATVYGMISAILNSVPIKIITIRGKEKYKSIMMYLINYIFYRFSKLIIYNSIEALEYEKKIYNLSEHKLKVVFNGINIDDFNTDDIQNRSAVLGIQVPENCKTIGTTSSLTKRKNLTMFLDCAKGILKKWSNFIFVIAGIGDQVKELKDYAKVLNIEKSVFFLGFRNDIPQLLKCFDALWLTSIEEGTPNSILEAMAAGIPVIATDVGGNREIIKHRINGFIVPLNDMEQMVNYTIEVLNKRLLKEKIIKEARETIRNKFDMNKMIAEMDNIYLSLV